MFTSRAEHRILLRQDNADLRLTEMGRSIGLATRNRYEKYLKRKGEVEALIKFLNEYSVTPNVFNSMLEGLGTSPLKQSIKLPNLITRPQVEMNHLMIADSELKEKIELITADITVIEQAEIQFKYAGYIQKEFEMAEEMKKKEDMKIPLKLDYNKIKSLSSEGLQKLDRVRPETIGQASRISGVSASDLSVLMIYLKN
jgi:tRNA uridine 5-carboxymethylaminomethyl modification enzyme